MADQHRFTALVIGGGIMGLAALEALTRLTRESVGLLERFDVGLPHGSSHGSSRVARSTYSEAVYARLMRRAATEDWPRIERESGEKLLLPSAGCFFGPAGGPVDGYLRAVRDAGFGEDLIEQLDPSEARRRYPSMRFDDCRYVLDDHTCAVTAASRTLAVLARLATERGAVIRKDTAVTAIDTDGLRARVITADTVYWVDHVIVTAGAWAERLVPALAARLTPLRQTVAYLHPAGERDAFRLGHTPLWVEIGTGADRTHYALPDLATGCLKIALHRISGTADDPDADPGPDPAEIERLRQVASRHMTIPIGDTERTETCLYTCTSNEDFILDHAPGDSRVVVGAGFSGHGFKFAPLVGRILAELAISGRCSVDEWNAERARFAIQPSASARSEKTT